MNKATVYIVILAVVCTLLGTVVGIGIEKRYTVRNFPRIAREQFLRHPQIARHQQKRWAKATRGARGVRGKEDAYAVLKYIGRELELSDEQTAGIQAILKESREEIKQASDEFRENMGELREKSRTQISDVLDPEQQEKFDQLMERVKQKRERKDRPFGYRRERE